MNEEQNAVASQESTEASQEPKQEASGDQVPVPMTETPEFKTAVERRAQSEADKRAKVFEEKINRLQLELESAKQSAQSHREESEIETILNQYVANGELPEGNVPPIRDFAKKTIERERQARENLRKAEEAVKEVAELKATRNILKLAAEQGVSLTFDDAEAIAKKTSGNTDWAEDLIKAKAKETTPEEKPKPKRPDSGLPTAPGGKLSDMQLREQYGQGKISDEAYAKECKARGISP